MTNTPGQRWRREISLLLVGGLGLSALGVWLGFLPYLLFVMVSAYLGWHISNIYRLNSWLSNPKNILPPDAPGIWGDVYYNIYRRQLQVRKHKRKLKRALKRFNKSTACLPDATILLGKNGEIEWWNKAAENLLGLRNPTDKGQRITNLIRHPEFIQRLEDDNWDQPLELPSPISDNAWFTLRSECTTKNKRLLQVRDSTRLHQLEQMRSDFVANVSHELRTPLTVVNGYVESLLDRRDVPNGPWLGVLSEIHKQSQRMQRIVEDLLLLSRLELNHNQTNHVQIHVDPLLQRIRDEALVLSGAKQHRIEIQADPGLDLSGNPEELRSALSNLVFNAVRYTPEGGEIHLVWHGDEQGACFSVSDTGIGIEPHHIPRLTERFYRVDVGRSRTSGGTGLGLAIVKHVLSQHDGELLIESQVGKGSTFTCRFPVERIIWPHPN
jgi:two-component system phosphate regulon sensor histidine kinase PhoR